MACMVLSVLILILLLMMKFLALTILLPILGSQALCTRGADGLSCNVTITHTNATCKRVVFNTAPNTPVDLCSAEAPSLHIIPDTNCFDLVWPGANSSFKFCNSTSPLQFASLGNGCFAVLNPDTKALSPPLCNGTTGPPGASGLMPSITDAGPGCFRISGIDGSAVWCNSTSPFKRMKLVIVDGIDYPLTTAGVTAALMDVYNPSGAGGTVLVTGDVDASQGYIPQVDRVTLDFGFNTIYMPTGNVRMATFAQNWGDPGTGTLQTYTIGTNLSSGVQCFNLSQPVWSLQTGNLVVIGGQGDTCVPFCKTNQYVSLVTNVTDGKFVCLHNALPWRLTQPTTLTVYGATERFTLRNVIIDINGNSAGGIASFLNYCVYCTYENIDLIGYGTGARGNGIFNINIGFGNRIRNIRSINATVVDYENRDLSFNWQAHAFIENIQSINFGGFGPNLGNSHHCTWTGLNSVRAHSRGFRVDSSTYNTFTNIVVSNAVNRPNKGAGTGIRVAFGSQYNVFTNVVTVDNDDMGFVIDGGQGWDSYNTVYGLLSYRNRQTNADLGNCVAGIDLVFGVYTTGNVVHGRVGCPAGNSVPSANTFISDGQSRGDFSITLRDSQPAAADFNGYPNMLIWSLKNNNQLVMSVLGSDGVIRRAVLALS